MEDRTKREVFLEVRVYPFITIVLLREQKNCILLPNYQGVEKNVEKKIPFFPAQHTLINEWSSVGLINQAKLVRRALINLPNEPTNNGGQKGRERK